jgi:glycosyltransferase involved in cell wall biosynthesis
METIMGAAEMLRHEREIVFLLVGEGHKKKWAMDYARGKGLDNCRFHGYVAREELGHLLSLADLGLVSLGRGQEGLSVPSKTFGLMAAGVPVAAVVSHASEIARVVREEDCGVRIEPGRKEDLARAVSQLCGNRKMRRTMGANGLRAIRRKYSIERASLRYLDLLAKVGSESRDGQAVATGLVASPGNYPSSLDA